MSTTVLASARAHARRMHAVIGNVSEVLLELTYSPDTCAVRPLIGGNRIDIQGLDVTVLHANERGKPRDPKAHRIDAHCRSGSNFGSEASRSLRYAMHWKIKTFHEVLPVGNVASTFRDARPCAALIAPSDREPDCRVFGLTILNRTARTGADHVGNQIIDRLFRTPRGLAPVSSLGCRLTRLARLAGHLACIRHPLPGNQGIWKGVARVTDIELGYLLAEGHWCR